MLNAGTLDKRITIQQVQQSQDGTGQPIETWSTLATVWAGIIDSRGDERFRAGQEGANVTRIFRVRYRSDLDEQMRILYDGRYYDIKSIISSGLRGLEYIDITAIFVEGYNA